MQGKVVLVTIKVDALRLLSFIYYIFSIEKLLILITINYS